MINPQLQSQDFSLAPRPIRGLNRVGLYTLIRREILRFTSVYLQTLVAPVVTALMFYAVFALAFGGAERMVGNAPFLAFLAPGLIMMTMAQNSFANTSSSLIIAKVQGNIVDILMPPLSNAELLAGFTIGGLVRGLAVGLATGIGLALFAPLPVHSPGLILLFAVLGTMLLSSFGLLAGLWSEKFDHLAAFTNFFITPLTFLSGTFYSIESLPPAWHGLALYNPFFYMIDGFRAGFTGHADGNLTTGFFFLTFLNLLLMALILLILRTGYKIRS